MNENWQKYLIGVAVAALLALYGATCVVRARAWVPGSTFFGRGGPITGREAVFMGVAYLGAAGYLFARFHLENAVHSTRAQNVTYLLQVGALVVFIVGVGLALRFGLYL
jgi:hypothetical protein